MDIFREIRQWVSDLSGLFFPKLCEVCDRPLVHGEEIMCLHCLYGLPLCNIHNDSFNTIHQRLMRHVPIERAAAYFYYHRDSSYTNLILSAKYRDRPRIIETLAEDFARLIAPDGFFKGIDLILPVPMHRSKKLRRGYNQTEYLARGINKVTGIPVGDNLLASRSHDTQTRKGAYRRWLNAQNIYAVCDSAELDGKHILIVDDVITTGATLMACSEAVHQAAPTATVSVLTLAATELQ